MSTLCPACSAESACTITQLSLDLLTGMDCLAAGIEVTVTEEPCSRVRLSVKVPPFVIEECYSTVFTVFTASSKVPGFRPGKKVPRRRLINHVGEYNFWWHVRDVILKWTLLHAMSSLTERVLKESARIIPKSFDINETFCFRHDYLSYDVVVDVVPEVNWIPENGYKNLKVILEVDTDIDGQLACEAEIERLHKALGSKTVITERGLQPLVDISKTAIVLEMSTRECPQGSFRNIPAPCDMAVLEISTRKSEDDEYVETIPPADSKDFRLDTEKTDNLPPGYLDSIIGIQKGEIKSFSLLYPESWRQESLQGVHVKFVVECRELFYRDLPVLNDSIAERLLPGCNTLCQVRESLLQRFKFLESADKELATDQAIFDQLLKMVEVDVPQFLFEQQRIELFAFRLSQVNLEPNEEQLKSMLSLEAVDEYLEKEREHITNLVKQKLVVLDIIRRENLQVEDSLEEDVVLDFLRKNASIQYVSKIE